MPLPARADNKLLRTSNGKLALCAPGSCDCASLLAGGHLPLTIPITGSNAGQYPPAPGDPPCGFEVAQIAAAMNGTHIATYDAELSFGDYCVWATEPVYAAAHYTSEPYGVFLHRWFYLELQAFIESCGAIHWSLYFYFCNSQLLEDCDWSGGVNYLWEPNNHISYGSIIVPSGWFVDMHAEDPEPSTLWCAIKYADWTVG